MVRTFVGGALSLVLVAGFALAQQGQQGQGGQGQAGQVQGGKQTPGQPQLAREMQGKIVRVDPERGMIVIRVRDGAKEQEREYRVGKMTRFFGNDNKDLRDGLRTPGFRQGADVWFRYGRDGERGDLGELRLSPFTRPGTPGTKGGTTPGTNRPQPQPDR